MKYTLNVLRNLKDRKVCQCGNLTTVKIVCGEPVTICSNCRDKGYQRLANAILNTQHESN